jgi:hypothetical protein
MRPPVYQVNVTGRGRPTPARLLFKGNDRRRRFAWEQRVQAPNQGLACRAASPLQRAHMVGVEHVHLITSSVWLIVLMLA